MLETEIESADSLKNQQLLLDQINSMQEKLDHLSENNEQLEEDIHDLEDDIDDLYALIPGEFY